MHLQGFVSSDIASISVFFLVQLSGVRVVLSSTVIRVIFVAGSVPSKMPVCTVSRFSCFLATLVFCLRMQCSFARRVPFDSGEVDVLFLRSLHGVLVFWQSHRKIVFSARFSGVSVF